MLVQILNQKPTVRCNFPGSQDDPSAQIDVKNLNFKLLQDSTISSQWFSFDDYTIKKFNKQCPEFLDQSFNFPLELTLNILQSFRKNLFL